MAIAKECDRCKALFRRMYVPDIRINKYVHGYGDEWIDLCPTCQSKLEKWLKGEIELEERKEK